MTTMEAASPLSTTIMMSSPPSSRPSSPVSTTTCISSSSINNNKETKKEETKTSSSKKKKIVSFSTVEIREYDQTLGDNPAVRNGPPIQLDWDYNVESNTVQDLDTYESQRSCITSRRSRRRRNHELVMSYYQRQNKLIHIWGYTSEEVRNAKKQAKIIKRQRWISLQMSLLETTFESASTLTIMAMKWYGNAWTSAYDNIEWNNDVINDSSSSSSSNEFDNTYATDRETSPVDD